MPPKQRVRVESLFIARKRNGRKLNYCTATFAERQQAFVWRQKLVKAAKIFADYDELVAKLIEEIRQKDVSLALLRGESKADQWSKWLADANNIC